MTRTATRIACWIAMPLLLSAHGSESAYRTATIDPLATRGIWEGWGTSLCWWAQEFGARDDLADILFTTNHTTLNGTSLPGLGLNIAHYNVGAFRLSIP